MKAIDYATSAGLRELVKALSQAGEEHADTYGNTTLHHACWKEQSEVVKVLLEKDPSSVNKPNDEGEVPLILAVRRANLMIAELLLAAGARPDCADADGVGPLHIAADAGDLFIGKALLAAGASMNLKASDGQTPLILAARSGKNDFTAMLIEMGRLIALADKILEKWRGYTDEDAFIYAYTDGEPHNTITPIARKRKDKYELDLVLRNNITTEEHPLGVYHPHAKLHHIKKENIGLIEVMGLAVLPARLKGEMDKLADAILAGEDI